MTILVTGGTGLVGSHIVRQLMEQGRDVVAFDRLPPPPKVNALADMMDRLKLEIGNVADLSNVLQIVKKHKITGIIHTAAIVASVANEHPIEALNVNIIGSANMLEAARLFGLGRVIIYSSSGVMGAPQDIVTPRKEEEIVLPTNGIYPLSKLACEHLVYTYRELYGVDTISIRPRCVYGPGETRYHHPLPIYQVVFDALAGKDIIRATGGDTAFDYTYVKDEAQGTIQAYDCKSPSYHVYSLSRGKNTTMREVCDAVQKLFPKLRVEVGPGLWEGILSRGKQSDLVYRSSQRPPQDITRARTDFGFDPKWDVDRAIPDWVNWLKKVM